MDSSTARPAVAILYGSQTGTAQDTAERVGRVLTRLLFRVKVKPMDSYAIRSLPTEDAVVFVCSTTGQGEEPDNMKAFWRFLLRRSLPPDALDGLSFAVLGLGDSSYPKFNFVAKRLFKRLRQLGGEPLATLGLCDDQHDLGVDGTAVPWIKGLKETLLSLYPLEDGEEPMKDGCLLPSKYSVEWMEDEREIADVVRTNDSADPPAADSPFRSTIVKNARVTAEDHWQDVRKISFDIRGSFIRYNPGDVLMIRPRNSEKSVETFCRLLHLDPRRKFRLISNDPEIDLPSSLPRPCSVEFLVRNYLDVNAIPRLYFWELLAAFTDDENEKEKLDEFLTPEGTQEMWDYCNRVRRNCSEVLYDFPFATKKIPFEYLFDLLTPLQPRAFSIASAQSKHGDTLEILMAVVNYKTKLFEPRLGVCSNWLAGVKPEEESSRANGDASTAALIWTRTGTINFPPASMPLIMIGPGTGVAPFRSVIHHRVETASDESTLETKRKCLLYLFFGCRNREKDFYCRDEWREMEESGDLRLFAAFSRDGEEKIYVQDRLMEESGLVWDLLVRENASVFIAGNAKRMPEDVWATFRKIAMNENDGMTELEAEEYFKTLERNGRYQTETWS